MDEKTIPEMLEETYIIAEEEQKEINRKIHRGIASEVYKRVLIVLGAAALVAACCTAGYRKYRDLKSFHLSDLENVLDPEVLQDEQPDVLNAQYYLNAYCELFMPGYVISYRSDNAERTDYGTYTFDAELTHVFRTNPETLWSVPLGTASAEGMVIQDGKIIRTDSVYHETVLNDTFWRWWESGLDYAVFYLPGDVRTELEEMPASALVELDVRLRDPVTVEEVLKMQAMYEDSRIIYCVTYIDEQPGTRAKEVLGFSMMRGTADYDNIVVLRYRSEDYPELDLPVECLPVNFFSNVYIATLKLEMQMMEQGNAREDMPVTAERLEVHYETLLKLLLDNNVLNERETVKAQAALEDLSANGVSVQGMRIICTKEEALEMMDSHLFRDVHINDAKTSRFDN